MAKKSNSRFVDVRLYKNDGSILKENKGVEVPIEGKWSEKAVAIAADKYFHGEENSVVGMIDRVVDIIVKHFPYKGEKFKLWGKEYDFESGLRQILRTQSAAFNTPVWINFWKENPHKYGSACFIFGIDDNLPDILDKAHKEAVVYSHGSGVGASYSALREKGAPLSGGGMASGPISFMELGDAAGAVVKSGGRSRRAAKMDILKIDHPDIEEFISIKGGEEKKAKALIAFDKDNGENFGWGKGGFECDAYKTVKFQNANLSVSITDDFMDAYLNDDKWNLISRHDGKRVKTVDAKEIMQSIARHAWECGDPGVQFYDTMNNFNPMAKHGLKINATNPCSEFAFIDNSACNLSALNLDNFLNEKDEVDMETIMNASMIMIMAKDNIIDISDYPFPELAENSRKFRPLGLGFTNLAVMLMKMLVPYASKTAVQIVDNIVRNMTYAAAKASQRINKLKKLGKEKDPLFSDVGEVVARIVGGDPSEFQGLANAQLTLSLPTGTVSFLMDCESTGMEPLVGLVAYKTMVGGGYMQIVPEAVQYALEKLGYDADKGMDYVLEKNSLVGFVRDEHLPIFKTALGSGGDDPREIITPYEHMDMMEVVQSRISGAISKTVNLPESITVEEIEDIYVDAWRRGLKAIAIYRTGSKSFEPLKVTKEKEESELESIKVVYKAKRERMPDLRPSITHKFEVGGHEGYLNLGFYPDGRIGEMFVTISKEGSTLSGLLDAFATSVSIGLQYGIPIGLFVEKFEYTKFEPAGFTSNPHLQTASSIIDYIFRFIKFLHTPEGVKQLEEMHLNPVASQRIKKSVVMEQLSDIDNQDNDGDFRDNSGRPQTKPGRIANETGVVCSICGSLMVKNGSTCNQCLNCGATDGCS